MIKDLDFFLLLTKEGGFAGPPGCGQIRSGAQASAAPPEAANALQLTPVAIGSKEAPGTQRNRVATQASSPVSLVKAGLENLPEKPPPSKEQIALISALGGLTGATAAGLLLPRSLLSRAAKMSLPRRALLAGGIGTAGLLSSLAGLKLLQRAYKDIGGAR